jgi:hypothetical protein
MPNEAKILLYKACHAVSCTTQIQTPDGLDLTKDRHGEGRIDGCYSGNGSIQSASLRKLLKQSIN